MKTKMISIVLFSLFVIASAFTLKGNSKTSVSGCISNPTVSVTTDNASYIWATAGPKSGYSGFEWTVSGGFIISGQGTFKITMGKDCPTGTIQACVRAFKNLPGGGICYADIICGSVNYTGPCFN